MKTSNTLAVKIAEHCETAYSYDAYTESGWRNCAKYLARSGFSPFAIETILCSKWTRWAGDGSSKSYGQYNSVDLKNLIEGADINPNNWQSHMQIDNVDEEYHSAELLKKIEKNLKMEFVVKRY